VRGVASGGGRRRGRGEGADGRREFLAVEMKERDRDPDRNAIFSLCIGKSQRHCF
jgi:hypothetical protein